ncbi:hypothetical protein C7B67_18905 [filamentous cyanobacterium Phorm 6]|nr:hypothetical protein C7B67_18905 [filamentous cyanobacterium Phorm 6]
MFVADPQNLTTQLSPVLGFIARHGSEPALPVSPFWLDIVLRHSALRAIETCHTSMKANWPVSTKYIPS